MIGAAPDAVRDAEGHALALKEPDAQPLTDESLASMRLVPRTKTMRRALGLTQKTFAMLYHIPLGILRDREQGRSEPDQTARAYLAVMAHDPENASRI